MVKKREFLTHVTPPPEFGNQMELNKSIKYTEILFKGICYVLQVKCGTPQAPAAHLEEHAAHVLRLCPHHSDQGATHVISFPHYLFLLH